MDLLEIIKDAVKFVVFVLLLAIVLIMAWFWGEGNDYAYAAETLKEFGLPGGEKVFEDQPMIFTAEEETALLNLMMSEARGEDIEGMALIANVVLNRVSDSRFPSDIIEVINQPHQFAAGRSFTPSEECREALEMVRNGWDESQGALYFRTTSGSFSWATFLFNHGHHDFYIN